MAAQIGQFVWYELMTSDVKGALDFYGKVLGWTAKNSGLTDREYWMLASAGSDIAGLMAIPDEAEGMPPMWWGYISTADVDAAVVALQKAGGHLHRPGEDIPGVGRFAVVSDPDGAMFMLFTPLQSMQSAAPVAPPMTPGRVGWHELWAGDSEKALAFYANQFGWTAGEVIDSPTGPYRLFATGGQAVGGMMTKPPSAPRMRWLYYFASPGVAAAMARVLEAGGQVLNGPMEVPGGAFIAQCRDPQGAFFALVGPK